MCSPSLHRLDLDQLGMMALHPRAGKDVEAAFARVLTEWVHNRVRRLIGRWAQPAELDDVAANFVLRCYARHLPAWQDARCTLSSYLYTRLRCEVIDHQRGVCRFAGRYLDVAEVDVAVDARDLVKDADDRAREAQFQLLDDVIDQLPRRRRMIMRRTLSGETIKEIAKDKRCSTSTLSRERSLALQTIQQAFQQAA